MNTSRKMLWVLFIGALALRLAFVATRGDDLAYYDSRAYSQIAHNWVTGQGWHDDVGRQASRAPGYPLFLAACYSLGIEKPRAIYALQAVADALMCVLLALLGRRVAGARVGLIAGWVAAGYPFFIYFTGLMLAETLFILGLVGFMLVLTRLVRAECPVPDARQPWGWILLAGLLAGVLTHLRSSFLLFPCFLLPFWLLAGGKRVRALAAWAAMVAVMALVLLPWVVRNYALFHHVVPTTLQVGESLYEANHPGADGGPAMEKIDWIALRGGGMMGEYDHNECFKKLAVRYIREHPGECALLAVKKFGRFWNPLMNTAEYHGRLHAAVSLAVYVPIMALALFGVVRAQGNRAALLLLLAPVLYYTAMHMVFVGSVRYRVPVMPFVVLLAAMGAAALWRSPKVSGPVKRRFRWVRWAVWALVLIAIAGATLYQRYLTPDRLRVLAREQIARVTGGRVEVADAQFALSNGLVLDGIQVWDPQSPTQDPALTTGRVTLVPRWGQLLRGKRVLEAVAIEDLAVRVELDEAGRWPFVERMSTEGARGAVPPISVRQARVRTAPIGSMPGLELSNLNIDVEPFDVTGRDVDVAVSAPECGYGQLRLFMHVVRATGQVDVNVTLSNAVIDERVRALLPASVRAPWDALAPQGRVDLEASARRDPGRQPAWEYEANAVLREATVKPARAPWPITDLSAKLNLKGRTLRIASAQAKGGGAALSGAAAFTLTPDNAVQYEFDACARGVTADAALRARLPTEIRAAWDRFQPGGRFNVLVKGKSDGASAPVLTAGFEFDGMTGAPRELPVAFSDIRGAVDLDSDGLTVHEITGKAGGAPFRIPRGFISLDKAGRVNLLGTVTGLKLAGRAAGWIPAPARERLSKPLQEWLDQVEVGGELDLAFSLERLAEGREAQFQADVTARAVVFDHPDLIRPVKDLQTHLRYTPGLLTLAPVRARWGEARLEMPETRVELRADAAQNLLLNARDLNLSRDFQNRLPESIRKHIEEYGMEGTADIEFRLGRAEGRQARWEPHYFIRLRDGLIQYTGFPYPARQIVGQMEFVGPSLVNAAFVGKNGPTDLTLTIVDKPFTEPDGKRYEGKLINIQAHNGVMNTDLRDAMPTPFKRLWDDAKPRGGGELGLVLHRYYIPQPDGSEKERVWFAVDVQQPEIVFETDVPVAVRQVRTRIEEAWMDEDNRVRLKGRIEVGEMEVEHVLVQNLQATFRLDRNELTIEDLSALCYGGALIGRLVIPESPDDADALASAVQGSLYLRDADVTQIAAGTDIRHMDGRLNASTDFTGVRGQDAEFRAIGAMTIRDGHLGELPGLLGVINVLQLREPNASAFHSLELAYEMRGAQLIAHEFNLLGNVVSLYGHGVMGGDKQVNFTFRPEFGPRLPPIPLVRSTLDRLKDLAIPVTVKGDYNDPVVRLNPVLSLTRLAQRTVSALIPHEWRMPKKTAGAPTRRTHTED